MFFLNTFQLVLQGDDLALRFTDFFFDKFHIRLHFFYSFYVLSYFIKPGLHLNANVNDTCGSEARQNVWYIGTLLGHSSRHQIDLT